MPPSSPKPVHVALAEVMRSVTSVGKDARNPQQNYSFRSADAVVAAVGPALREHGVLIVPEIVDQHFDQITVGQRGTTMQFVRLLVAYTVVGPAGDTMRLGPVWGEAMDSGDKASNKALTAAQKYALCQSLMIPTHDPDADQFSPGESEPAQVDLNADAREHGYKDEMERQMLHHKASEEYAKIPAAMPEGRRKAKKFKGENGPVFTKDAIDEWIAVIELAKQGGFDTGHTTLVEDEEGLRALGEEPF